MTASNGECHRFCQCLGTPERSALAKPVAPGAVQPKKSSRDGFQHRMGLVIIHGMDKAPQSKLRRLQNVLYVLLVFVVTIPTFIGLDRWLLPDYFPRIPQKNASYLALSIQLSVALVQGIIVGLLVFILIRRPKTQGEVRWFSLRIGVLVMLCALPCSWFTVKMHQAKRQQAAVRAIEASGGTVGYDGLMWNEETPGPAWLATLLGKDFLVNVGSVRLDKTKATDADLENLKGLPRLHLLWLEDIGITDAGLVNVKGLTGLQMLALSHTKITGAGLVDLKGLPQLRSLFLLGAQVTDAGLEHIKGLTQLELLSLPDTKITDAGLTHIKELTGLQSLILADTKITDAGLAYLKGLKSLRLLDLRDTRITDAGLEHLKGMPQLQMLCLDRTEVTKEGVGKLQRALPRCRIYASPRK